MRKNIKLKNNENKWIRNVSFMIDTTVGVNWSFSPINFCTKNALGIGIFSPQIGIIHDFTLN